MDSTARLLYLIPSRLGEEGPSFLDEASKQIIFSMNLFVVENERTARRFLKSVGCPFDFSSSNMVAVPSNEVFLNSEDLKNRLRSTPKTGLLSEAGCPGIADPGSALVRWAHEEGIRIIPMPGPSSIFLALMASGLNGQQFAFHGYLPVKPPERRKKLKSLEEISAATTQTQIWMETPYRNDGLMSDMLSTLRPGTLLTVACNLTLPGEFIRTRPVKEWKNDIPELDKKPAIFLLQA